MICKQCGAINEEGLRVCRVCSAPLGENNELGPRFVQPPNQARQQTESNEEEKGWNFVRAPRWPNPVFDPQAVTQEELQSVKPKTSTGKKSSVAEAGVPASTPRRVTPEVEKPTFTRPSLEEESGAVTFVRTAGNTPKKQAVVTEEDPFADAFAPVKATPKKARRFDEEEMIQEPVRSAKNAKSKGKQVNDFFGDEEFEPEETLRPKKSLFKGKQVNDFFDDEEFEPEEALRPKKQNKSKAKQVIDDFELDDDYSLEDFPPARKQGKSRGKQTDDFFDDEEYESSVSLTYDEEFDDEDFDDGFGMKKSRGKKQASRSSTVKRRGQKDTSSRNNVLFWVATVVLSVVIIVLLVSLFTRNSGGIQGLISGIFSSSVITKDPEVELVDGNYLITIYAKNGSIVRFKVGDTPYDQEVKGGSAKFKVAPQIFTPSTPVESSPVNVVPDIVIIDKEGVETKVEMEPISIEVPTIQVTLTSPGANVTTNDGLINFEGTVSDPSAQVFVNDQQLTVNVDGTFTGTYQLTETGTHTLTVEGRLNGAAIGRQVVTAVYEGNATPPSSTPSSGNIALAAGTVLRTTETTLSVSGTMDPGSNVTVTGAVVEGSLSVNSEAGTFSFKASVPEVGVYKATVTAVVNGQTYAKEIHLEHAPNYESYTQTAFRFDYAAISANPKQNQAYKAVGTIEEVLQSGETVLAKMKLSDGNYIVLEYHPNYATAATIEANDGKTYNVFGFPNGTHEVGGKQVPLFYGWFVLKK